MQPDSPLGDGITPLPGSAAAAVAWRSKGELHATVIVKATFAFAQAAEMSRTPPQEVIRAEVHESNNPARCVRLTSDLAPYLARADVLMTGHAHAPAGGPAKRVQVRLGLFDGASPILDKTVVAEDAAGFSRMPLVYERALGGMGHPENPFGSATPTLIDPIDSTCPAGFGAISRTWPVRKQLLGSTPRKQLDAPIAEIPDGFDWSYFQSAPRSQQVPFLRGDEWIVIDGVHPTLPRLQTRLPHARGLARVFGLAALGVKEGQPLDLQADTLRIDADNELCTLVFRGSFRLPSEDALSAVQLLAGVQVGDEPLDWPAPPPRRERPSLVASPSSSPAATAMVTPVTSAAKALGTIAVMSDGPASAAALPFQPSATPVLLDPEPAHPPVKDRSSGATFALSSAGDASAALRPATPFDRPRAEAPLAEPPPPELPRAPVEEARQPPPAAEEAPAVAEIAEPVAAPPEEAAPPPPRAPRPPPRRKKPPVPEIGQPLPSPALKKGLYGRFGGS